MQEHRDFDNAVDEYARWNQSHYSYAEHVTHVRKVLAAGDELLYALGAAPPQPLTVDKLLEAAMWALQYFERLDVANAAIHCASVRYSPITFKLALSLRDLGASTETVQDVVDHAGAYQPDPGR